jgi:Flp pilus assembly protein TadD
MKAYDKAIEINPPNTYAWTNKGVTLGQLGKSDEAISI